MKKSKTRKEKRKRRQERIRARIKGTKDCPRISVFRSLNHISAQLIDDEHGKTLISVSDKELSKKRGEGKGEMSKGIDRVFRLGLLLAKKAKEKKVVRCVFDRSGYKYHGKVKALAEGAREGGLKF